MKRSGRQNDKGFTLIESIITIVAAAILATMVFTYSQTSLTKSAQPLNQAKKAMALQKVMENIFADNNKIRPTWQASHAYVSGDEVFPAATSANNGHYYICTKSGTSSSPEPTWPPAISATVTDGGVIWREGLQTKIGAEGATCNSGATTCVYGQYTVVYNRMVTIQTTDPNNSILQVTIKDDLGETLSILLTKH
jgi:prepilin-type N-terminal cleavage/methylation domain-containing protein